MVGAPEAVLYRNVARGQVDQRRGNEERADPPRTAGVQQNRRLLDRLEAADAGADHDAGPLLRLLVRRLPPRIFDRHARRSEEHTSELQSLMRISYAVFCLKKKRTTI